MHVNARTVRAANSQPEKSESESESHTHDIRGPTISLLCVPQFAAGRRRGRRPLVSLLVDLLDACSGGHWALSTPSAASHQ